MQNNSTVPGRFRGVFRHRNTTVLAMETIYHKKTRLTSGKRKVSQNFSIQQKQNRERGGNMGEEQKKRFILEVAFLAAAGGTVWFVCSFVLPWMLPFVIGFIIAFLLKPVTVWLTNLTNIRRQGISFGVMLLFYLLLGALLWTAGVFLVREISQLAQGLPDFYSQQFFPALTRFNHWLTGSLSRLSPQTALSASGVLEGVAGQLAGIVASFSGTAVSYLTGLVGKLPLVMLTFLFSVMCSVFISMDYNTVVTFLLRQLPESWQDSVFEMKDFLAGTFVKMVKAYAIILCITWLELWAGFFLLGVEYAFSMAVLTAVLDILPFIGTGLVLVPWGLYELLAGNIPLGAGLLLLYAVVTVARNIMEPKIVGEQIGLHPVLTITAMYAGLRMFGFPGFLAAPVLVLLLRFLCESGKLRLFR